MTKPTYSPDPLHFKQISQFDSLKDFNNNYEMWLADHKRFFTKRELNFLNVYRKYAAKVPGIVTAKIKTVVQAAIEEYKLKTSERSAQRALAKARKIGIITLHTSYSPKTGLRGPNIAQFNKYVNGGTVVVAKETKQTSPNTTAPSDAEKVPSMKKLDQNGGTLNCSTQAFIIKILNTLYTRKPIIKTVTNCLRLKNTAPITNPVTRNPLLFVSRLKTVVYKSLLNTKKHAEDIKRMVYGKVNKACKIPFIQPHQKTLLERSLRIVDTCLTAHKTGQLTSINNMQAFISSCLDNEIKAFIDLHIEAENNASTYYSAFNSGDFYDWSLD